MADPSSHSRPFPQSGGECSALLEEIDWSTHPLGEPADWPVELKTAVRICLTTRLDSMVHWGPDLYTFYNDAYAARLGSKHPGHLGQPAKAWWSEAWHQFEPFMQKVLAGETHYAENARYTPDRYGGKKDAYFTHCHSPIWDDAGNVRGIYLTVFETTARIEAEIHNELLLDELKHRMKNMLAVIQSIVNQAMRSSSTKEQAATEIRGQIAVLSRTTDLLTQSNSLSASIVDIMDGVAELRASYGSRITTSGPKFMLNSRASTAFTMLLHELTTNAMKYGALSNECGRIEISWQVSDDQLEWRWQEIGGPIVAPPTRSGFGSRLLPALADDLGGVPNMSFQPEGLLCRLRARLGQIEASDGPQ